MLQIYYTPGDGHTPQFVGSAETLAEARSIIRQRLGLKRLHKSRRFEGYDLDDGRVVEGWNEHPSMECGFYTIEEV